MSRTRWPAAVLALCAAAAVGCGIGPGEEEGDVALAVTRDYGSRIMLEKTDSIHESDSVIRLLDRNADITTRYGGGFVQSIDGLSSSRSGGRTSDWFFYVNGIESPVGSAEYDPSGGDRVWWDYRDWTAAMRVPAVVGSWPEPFVHGFRGDHWRTSTVCRAAPSVCAAVDGKLTDAGVTEAGSARGMIQVVVGTWQQVRGEPEVGLLSEAPERSGVFARFIGSRRPVLELLNEGGDPAGSIGKGGGLVAALREGDDPPIWVVTGTDDKGVAAAANLLGDQLRNHYAVATQPGAECEGARQRNPCYVAVPVP